MLPPLGFVCPLTPCQLSFSSNLASVAKNCLAVARSRTFAKTQGSAPINSSVSAKFAAPPCRTVSRAMIPTKGFAEMPLNASDPPHCIPIFKCRSGCADLTVSLATPSSSSTAAFA